MPSDAAAALVEGTDTLARLAPLMGELLGQADIDIDLALRHAAREPMSYLVDLPVPAARLVLAAGRGLVAYVAIEALLGTHWFVIDDRRAAYLAGLVRDGMRALARLLASVRPDWSLTLIPAEERLDADGLRSIHQAEEARLRALAASAVAQGDPVYSPPDDA